MSIFLSSALQLSLFNYGLIQHEEEFKPFPRFFDFLDDGGMNPIVTPGYWPLDAADAIRLVVLHPGSRSECIRLSLVYTTLSELPVYDALSYAWGSSEVSAPGYMDDAPTTLRQNLWSALIHLRSASHERVLWIDAICIDQNNIEERNRQIKLMGDIYSKADAVIIWLGTASDTSDTAMEWIRDCSSRFSNSLGLRHQSLGRLSASQVIQQQADKWRALEDLCSRDYWHRVWIVQEVVLARRLIISCGGAEAKWDGFSSLMDDYDALFKPNSCRAVISRIRQSLPAQLQLLRKMHRSSSSGCTLLALMQMTSGSLSSDPRDKVYGLLGLASDGHEFRLAIDYSKNLLEMYQSLWHSLVSVNSPSAYDVVSNFFHCILKNTPFEPSAGTDVSRSELYVLGRSVGTIVYAGQPWRDRRGIDVYSGSREWFSTMEELRSEGLPVEQRLQVFKAAFSRTKFILADPFSPNSRNLEVSRGNHTAPTYELDEEVVIQPENLYDQSLIVLSGGQIAITMSSACVGDEVYQFQDRRVTVVCCYRSGEMKCNALLPWRRDGERIRDAPMDPAVVGFHAASGAPIERQSKPGDEILKNTKLKRGALSEMPSHNSHRTGSPESKYI
jgi:hypothetical protein